MRVSHLQNAETSDSDAFSFFQMSGDQTDQIIQEFMPRPLSHIVIFG